MKNVSALLVFCLLTSNILLGCRERIELENQAGFIKSHGFDKESYANDMIELNNGDLLIVGNFSKTSNIGCCEDIDGPFVLRADANGNELRFQNFYFTRAVVSERIQLYNDWYGLNLTDSLEFTGATFKEVAQLKNGNFLVIGYFFAFWEEIGSGDVFDFLMIMDENFELQEFKFFYNSQAEFQSGRERYFGGQNHNPIVLDDGDILLLLEDVYIPWPDVEGYSIYRISPEGNFKNIWDYTLDEFIDNSIGWSYAADWVLDPGGNIVVYGMLADHESTKEAEGETRDNSLFLNRIDPQTGTRLQSKKLSIGNYNFVQKGGIQLTANGFAMSDYHIDTVGENNIDPEKDGYRNFYGGLWFVDQNFDSLKKAHLTDPNVDRLAANLVGTRDGGFVTAYSRRSAGSIDRYETEIIKSDSNGEVIWRYFIPDDVRFLSKIIETRDGGIAILFNSDFNSTGSRVKLIKLTANGTF